MKVLIIIPYFGELPPWFDFFLQTCEANPEFSWLIYSNCENPDITPENVKFITANLLDFNRLSSKKLNLKINIINPYKICDLRPSFGKIFEDYIKDYDFWGYSDLDLVYGNLKHFITKKLLSIYDLVSVRKNYFAGHFALYKNTKIVNTLYKKGYRYKEIFQDHNRHYAYDERSNVYGKSLFQNKNTKLIKQIYISLETLIYKVKFRLKYKYSNPLQDMTSIVEMASSEGVVRLYARDMVASDRWFHKHDISQWKITWKNGELYNKTNNKELLHFHIIESKKNRDFSILKWRPNTGFIITNEKISV